ncbi:unnamed protein product [Pseudo-nitzschia multistriata]|uniref:FAS1 domain-containing protein n=1 Tax=Pseudo-nitzschia multistriata TaxID=183589 RepID=A0A448ZJ18_9STRA|nr:unnamed protein product [Pseudo-nitzschia multistriata]
MITNVFFPKSTQLACSLALLLSTLSAAVDGECNYFIDLVCNSTDFSTICELISLSDATNEAINEGNWTIFVPTNAAFEKLNSDLVDNVLNCTTALDDFLGFHSAANGELVKYADLECGGVVEMANGDESRTVCQDGKIFQKGGLNAEDSMPEIISADIETCEGVLHVVDKVLLPQAEFLSVLDECESAFESQAVEEHKSESCKTIVDLICEKNEFMTFCDLITDFDLAEALSRGTWTVFAPTDDAFDTMVEHVDLTSDEIVSVVRYHLHDGSLLFFEDLVCRDLIPMANGRRSRTKCQEGIDFEDSFVKYQRGPGQVGDMLPEITTKNLGACNGVVHVVNHVMIPRLD